MKNSRMLWPAVAVVVVWLAITIYGGNLQGGGKSSLDELVKHGVLWALVAALAFLAVMTRALGARGLGFVRADWGQAVRLMWLPLALVALVFGVAVAKGLPAPATIGWILLNCTMVGVSEEWAYRGILLRGLRARFSLWPAALWCSLFFGLAHAANVFVTGDLRAGLTQAGAATMSGVLFTALRIRTGSLLPVMALHAVWDFSVFMLVSSPGMANPAPAEVSSAAELLVALLPVLPNLLYGIYLLRGARSAEEKAGS